MFLAFSAENFADSITYSLRRSPRPQARGNSEKAVATTGPEILAVMK